MNDTRHQDSHPAPHRGRVETYEALFSVWAAPLAWFVQLCAGYAVTRGSCFQAGDRLPSAGGPPLTALLIGIACLIVALSALWFGTILLRRTQDETGGGHRTLFETGHGRTRFLALWGIAFSLLFAALILINIVAMLGVPVCGG